MAPLYLWLVLSGTPASDPSPHLMSIECGGVIFLVCDFVEIPEKSTTVVMRLAMKRVIAMANFMRLVKFEKPES